MDTKVRIKVPAYLSQRKAVAVLQSSPRTLSIDEYGSVLQQLSDSGIDINSGDSALLFAAFDNSDIPLIELLFKSGAKINHSDGLYKTTDIEGDKVSVFHANVSTGCEEVLLTHILSETPENQAIIAKELKDRPSRLSVFSDVFLEREYTEVYAQDFAKLCILAKTFPATNLPFSVMRECHSAGLTHPTYETFAETLRVVEEERDALKKALDSVKNVVESNE